MHRRRVAARSAAKYTSSSVAVTGSKSGAGALSANTRTIVLPPESLVEITG